MGAKYMDKVGTVGVFIFASVANKMESGISRSIWEEFKLFVGDNPATMHFNANSTRKFLERLCLIGKGISSDGVEKVQRDKPGPNAGPWILFNPFWNGAATKMYSKTSHPHLIRKRRSLTLKKRALEKLQLRPYLFPIRSMSPLVSTRCVTLYKTQPATVYRPVYNGYHPVHTPFVRTVKLTCQNPPRPQILKNDSMEVSCSKEAKIDTGGEKYRASLISFRSRLRIPEWTEEEKRAFGLHMPGELWQNLRSANVQRKPVFLYHKVGLR